MDDKKLEVLPIAIQLFSEKGYSATSVEEIAKACGMAKGSFYKLFHSKEDLLLEIFTLIPQQIKEGLTKIYSKTYTSNHDKLVDFISVSFENFLSNQTQLLMDTIFTHALFKYKNVEKRAYQMMTEFYTWIRELLLDIYGEDIQPYISDLVSLLTGLIFHYVHVFNYQKSIIRADHLAPFVATLFDVIVNGIMQRQPAPVIELEFATLEDSKSPFFKGQRIQLVLRRLHSTIKELKMDNKEDYLQTLALLEQQCTNTKQQMFLTKALIHYLQTVPEIQEHCNELTDLLEL